MIVSVANDVKAGFSEHILRWFNHIEFQFYAQALIKTTVNRENQSAPPVLCCETEELEFLIKGKGRVRSHVYGIVEDDTKTTQLGL